MNVYTSFTMQLHAHHWDGHSLSPINQFQGTALVDAVRNKAMIHATMDIAPLGITETNIMIDLGEGYALVQVPALSLCQYEEIGVNINLNETFAALYSSVDSEYIGEEVVEWDTHHASDKQFKFQSKVIIKDTVTQFVSYFTRTCMGTGNFHWLQIPQSGFTIEVPFGMHQSSFRDSDFQLENCQNIQIAGKMRISEIMFM